MQPLFGGSLSFWLAAGLAAGSSPLSATSSVAQETAPAQSVPRPTGAGAIALRTRTQDLSFAPQESYATEGAPWGLSMGDLDGDANVDLVTANAASNTVSVLLNEGDATFAPQIFRATGVGPGSVTTGDLDVDGALDLAVTNGAANTVSVLWNLGGAVFASHKQYATGNYPRSVAVGDIDGDADLDLVSADYYAVGVSVHRNQGHRQFGARLTFATWGPNPDHVTMADLDRDGDLDLLTSDDWSSLSSDVSLLWNNGAGSFETLGIGTVGHPSSVAVGDLDLDGDPDLVVTGNYPWGNTGAVHLNRGDGTFDPAEYFGSVGVVGNPTSGALDDLDRDGDLDVVVSDAYYSFAAVFVNRGRGQLPLVPLHFDMGTSPRSVASGDLDGDGDPDLAAGDLYQTGVSVLRNELFR